MPPPNVDASVRVGGEEGAGCRSVPFASLMADPVAAAATASTPTAAPGPSLFPVVDLSPLLDESDPDLTSPGALSACKSIADSLVATGCVVVRDPRVTESDSDRFLDLLERYFEQPEELKKRDARPELHYQIGATPEGTERPSMLREGSESAGRTRALVSKIGAREKPSEPSSSSSLPTRPRGADPKWRFFWRVGPRPSRTRFPELNAPQVVPEAFEGEWRETLDGWGGKMLGALDVACRAVARGLGMPSPDAISSMLREGPHLLAPTGSDLSRHSEPGTVLAGCHADLNLLTAHGRGRLPGLFVWTRDGERVAVRVPAGCLLLQAGMQLEYLTGGAIEAGMHEVLVTGEALERVKNDKISPWRVSSTVFGHVRSDETLRPLAPFDGGDGARRYPPVLAGDFVSRELEAIALKRE